jgi:hypothetical protein
MALTANQLRKQVDLPTWEWMRFAPASATSGLNCSCTPDNSLFNEISGRYIYYLINATNFWRYDTIADTYLQLASPPNAPLTASSMRYAGANGYYNRVIAATSTTIQTGLPSGVSPIGFNIRIISGRGAGQERVITAVADPVVADYGAATAGSTTSLTDTAKGWNSGYVGGTAGVNNWIGYVVRTLFGTGANQVRKILYNSATVLTTGDVNYVQQDLFSNNTWVAPAAGTVYQIESSIITVDTAWDVVPDSSSRFAIQSGGIWLASGAVATPFYTLQYYDILHDVWYARAATTNMVVAAPSDVSLERVTENSTIWVQSQATGGNTTQIIDTTQNWTTNQWAGYELYIYSGTSRGNVAIIANNTSTAINFPAIGVAVDTTSKYRILGYDGGTASSNSAFNTLVDSTKSWPVNRWGNYGVRILSGTGAGQVRQILTNDTTSLVIYGSWSQTPDTTSRYVIQGFSETMYMAWGGSSEVFMHNIGNVDMLTHGRTIDSGIASVCAALPCDSNHVIYEQAPIAIASLAGTTTITATSVQPHGLRTGQFVSMRGVTGGASDIFNVTGLVQVTNAPSTTTFTYTPNAAGSGTYTFLPALSTSVLSDASKDFRDSVSSATNTSITFTRVTPSHINGWYVTGTNVTPGTRVVSGAGTATVQLSAGAAVPSGTIIFSPWGPATPITATFSSGGGTGVANLTFSAAVVANTGLNLNGWYVTGTNMALNTTVVSGANTATVTLSNAMLGTPSGTYAFHPNTAAGYVLTMCTLAPAVTTGLQTGQQMQITSSATAGNNALGFITTLGTAPTAAQTRYTINLPTLLGAALDGSNTAYNSGIATGGSTTTLVDASSFWATATGTGTANTTTVTLSGVAPGSVNGWYISGTGITTGTQIVSGAGTNTLTVNQPHSGTVSGTMTCTAWNQSLVGRRIKIQSGATGLNQELTITVVAPTTGTLTFGAATAPVNGVAVYSLLSTPVKGAGVLAQWASGNSVALNRGKHIWLVRGGATVGADQLNINTDRIKTNYLTPFAENLGSGSMYAYDGLDRIYFTKDVTQRVYYIDLNTGIIHGAGMMPYLAGTAQLGNKMEVFTTVDGLKFLWVVRQGQPEVFRQLLFF